MNRTLKYPESYAEVIDLIVDCRGCLFGGAVRDFLRDDLPKDLDVSVRDYERFYDELESRGYHPVLDQNNSFSNGTITIDVTELDIDELAVDICVAPDFDVNTLAWDGEKLFNYWDPDYDITVILAHIQQKHAEKLSPTETRLNKMVGRGWTIS